MLAGYYQENKEMLQKSFLKGNKMFLKIRKTKIKNMVISLKMKSKD